jgi:hypothetical protein
LQVRHKIGWSITIPARLGNLETKSCRPVHDAANPIKNFTENQKFWLKVLPCCATVEWNQWISHHGSRVSGLVATEPVLTKIGLMYVRVEQ